jgi:hypothetical protein
MRTSYCRGKFHSRWLDDNGKRHSSISFSIEMITHDNYRQHTINDNQWQSGDEIWFIIASREWRSYDSGNTKQFLNDVSHELISHEKLRLMNKTIRSEPCIIYSAHPTMSNQVLVIMRILLWTRLPRRQIMRKVHCLLTRKEIKHYLDQESWFENN